MIQLVSLFEKDQKAWLARHRNERFSDWEIVGLVNNSTQILFSIMWGINPTFYVHLQLPKSVRQTFAERIAQFDHLVVEPTKDEHFAMRTYWKYQCTSDEQVLKILQMFAVELKRISDEAMFQ